MNDREENRSARQRESPGRFGSGDSLRSSSLTSLVPAVLASAAVVESAVGCADRDSPRRRSRLARAAPFIVSRELFYR
jgi:hypothetical protein